MRFRILMLSSLPGCYNAGMADTAPILSQAELALLSAAESRIDTAMAQLMLASRGVTDAGKAQITAVAELKAAGEAVRALRERLCNPPA